MIKNYLKIAWRNLLRNKFFSAINILGLALGLACSLLILLWVQNELSTDAFHKNSPRLYTVYEKQYYDHKIVGQYNTPGVLPAEMKKQIPEIEYATGYGFNNKNTFKVGDKILKIEGSSADSDYFQMFSYPLIQGNVKTALNTPSSLAISRKTAEEFFGSPAAAMGKTMRFENRKDFIVSAVFENVPAISSYKFDFLTNWDAFLKDNSWAKEWGNNGPFTYIQLRADANPVLVQKKITHFLDGLNKEQKKGTFTEELYLQRFDEGFLHGDFKDGKFEGGRIEYVRLFSIVAIFILLIACINFMNLTTARSVKRAKEIGVRKVIGAVRGVLIRQFIGESLLLTSIAVIFSLIMLVCLLPLFNSVTQKQIGLPFGQLSFWLKLLVITIVTGVVSGSYPAFFLSSFNPVKVLKGTAKIGSGAAWFRKGLVVFQFVLSVVLIIGTIIISKQVNYVQSINLGYDRENLIYIPLEGDLSPKYQVFKEEALKTSGIKSVTRMSQEPTDIENGTGGVDWDGKDPSLNIEFTQASVGYDFVNTMKLKMADGRDYSRGFLTDSVGFIINEAALKRIGYKDPVGKRLTFWGKKGKIIGVAKDFHFASLHSQIRPLVIRFGEKETYGSALVRTQLGKTKEALVSLEKLWRQMNPNFQFTYNFSDEEYKKLYNNEQIIGNIFNSFAFLAIFISCLGLLGLAMFTAEQRIKEIGIRKVLGASVGSLFVLLSREFLILVLISLLIASPLAWYFMDKWLMDFAYRTPIQWWVFALSGVIAILITFITVSFQSAKAALMNPVKSLRSE
jgi:putative ABC transport system permease protein